MGGAAQSPLGHDLTVNINGENIPLIITFSLLIILTFNRNTQLYRNRLITYTRV